MAFFGDNRLFASFDIDVTGEEGLDSLMNKFEMVGKKAQMAGQQMATMQKAFQAQTVPDLQRGSSIFAGPEGGPRQQGRMLSPVNDALQEAQQMSLGANEGLSRYISTTDEAGNRVMRYTGTQEQLEKQQKNTNKAVGDGNQQFGKMFGLMMNTMFLGMALNMVFGKMTRQMLGMTGASAAMGAAMKSVLLPFFIAITPAIIKLSSALMKLPKPIKFAIGAMVALLTVLGIFLFFGSQVGLLAISLGVSFTTLAGSILTVVGSMFALTLALGLIVYLFEKFGPIVAGVATVALAAMTAQLYGMVPALVSNIGLMQTFLWLPTALAARISTLAGATLAYASGALTSAISATLAWVSANSALLMTFGSILLVVGSLALGILLLNRIFKKFGPIVGLLATILGGALLAVLSPIAAVVFTIYGAFKAVNKIFKKFGKVAGLIAGIVVAAIGVLIATFASIPVGIGLAIGAVLAIIWNFRDEIGAAINAVINFFGNLVSGIGKWLGKAGKVVGKWVSDTARFFLVELPKKVGKGIDKFINFFKNLGSRITKAVGGLVKAGVDIATDIIDGIVNGIKSSADMILDALTNALPDWAVSLAKKTAGAIGSGLDMAGNAIGVNDFILSGDKLIQPDKRDTIVGAKPGGPIMSGGGGQDVTVNINDPVMKEDVDVQRVVDEVEDRVNRDTRGRSGLGT